MFHSAASILAGDDHHSVDSQAVAAQCETLQIVMATVARIARIEPGAQPHGLADSADRAGAIAALGADDLRQMARACDSLTVMLRAGLTALERARRAGRLNASAAELLYREARESFARTMAIAAV